jgi:Radical SAM superfamily/B12 binding domain
MRPTLRWVFIRPRHSSPYYDPEIQEPLGLEYLGAARRDRGDAVLIMDALLDGADEIRLARRALAFVPDAIGFSVMNALELPSVRAVYDVIRQGLAGREIGWLAGGNFISHEPEQALASLPPDFYLVRFEGENALERLAEVWSRPMPCAAERRPLPERVLCGAPVAEPDSLPLPLRPFADQITSARAAFNLQGSRGCLGACRYCSSPQARTIQHSRWRGRSMAQIAAEIDTLNRVHGACAFNFIDEDFLGPNPLALHRAREFAAALKQRKLRISFSIQVRPDSLNPEIIDHLADVGLSYVFIGIESDDPQDFKRWGRPWIGPPWELVTHIRRRGVEVGAGVLLFHPHANFRGVRRFAEQLQRHGLLNYRTAINRMDAMPGSAFHQTGITTGALAPVAGPQRLAFRERGMERFYQALTAALSPLGPTAMHAVCCLPPAVAAARLTAARRDVYEALKQILGKVDNAVARTFFPLLDAQACGANAVADVDALRKENLQLSLDAAHCLAALNLVSSFDLLREAIRMDAGL